MKKFIMIILCFSALAGMLTGCSDSNGNIFEAKNYVCGNTEISEINIDVKNREIEVSVSNDNQVHIDYFESGKEYYDIAVSYNKVLNMTSANSKEWTDYIGKTADAEYRKIHLQLPDNLLTKLSLSTTNENIILSSLTVTDSVSISANGGNTVFDKLNSGNSIIIKSKNGNISGTITGGYDDYTIDCKVKKGKSNLPAEKNGGEKTLNVSNNNGDIDIKFVRN